ncbi:RNA polymerase sigma factor [Flavivirga aquimarina]|uniref:RNA polymerase sigma factor n=1 Tax=Flavivirga aquimarina TaxID=2027862 RepID=A0ABT8WB69_9FLAO|nr:RNA polymerase sigma factor [Flavivirga aquimarina]MDO5970272.1 RNA polymerase sigma factor [Flavivirga aquimarina]
MNKKYTESFENLRKELTTFLYRMVGVVEDAEDIVQETYIKVVKNIDTFRKESSFKTWVFTIAINTSKNYLNKVNRWKENVMDTCANLHMENPSYFKQLEQEFHATPDANFEIKEQIDYCFSCIGRTLELEQQICLLLKDVYGFTQKEIGTITELSSGKVKHGITNARNNMKRIFKERCSLINKNGICTQCTSLKGLLNPEQEIQIELNKLKLEQEKDINNDKMLELRLEIVKSIDPVFGASTGLHQYFLNNINHWITLDKNKKQKLV